jgi:uncharacterized protein
MVTDAHLIGLVGAGIGGSLSPYLGPLFHNGHILMSGPLGEGGRPTALLITQADDADGIAELLDKDPFHEQGLIVEREIRPWNLVYGSVE